MWFNRLALLFDFLSPCYLVDSMNLFGALHRSVYLSNAFEIDIKIYCPEALEGIC